MSKKILILGINGFIGSHLTDRILADTDWQITGMDMSTHNIKSHLQNSRLNFLEGDITKNSEWVEKQVKNCDVILPLVAIATPATYVQNPLRVFELDFEANLPIIRHCVRYKKRVLFPSTSEVYGMCADEVFDETESNLTLGPIHKERWIYSCSKQLLDRIIYAYGAHQDLAFTLFRPFNWIGPRQDNILDPEAGSSRVLTQFISNIINGRDIQIVDGGDQQRCFTYIDDGISALMKIIENKNDGAKNRIFNIGNPDNNFSIKELADMVVSVMKTYPAFAKRAQDAKIIMTKADNYYGSGYQDVQTRVPAIENAKQYLNWLPETTLETALRKTFDYYLETVPELSQNS